MTPQLTPDSQKIWYPGEGEGIPEPPKPVAPAKSPPWFSEKTHAKLTQTALNLFNGFSEGLTLQRIIPTIALSAPVRTVEKHVLKSALLYIGVALTLDAVNDTFVSEDSDGIQPINFILKTGIFALSSMVYIRFLLNSSIDYMSMASAARKLNLPHIEALKCDCEFKASIPGVLNDPITNIFGVARLMVLGLIPVVGPIATSIYGSIIYGNALIQSRLSMCLGDRREYVKNHIFSVMGYGASFLFATQIAYFSINRMTGRDGFLLYDALFTFIYHQFILHAHVAELVFRPDVYTFDPTYLDHRRTDAYLVDLAPLIKVAFGANKTSPIPKDKILALLQNEYVRLWTDFDLRTRDQAFENKSLKLFITLVQPTLMVIIDELLKIPENQGVVIGKRIEKWGKVVGFESEGTNLARLLWNLREYLSSEYLEPIRTSINIASGRNPADFAKPTISPLKEIILEPIDEEKYFDAYEKMPVPRSKQVTLSFDHKTKERKSKSTLVKKETNTNNGTNKPSTTVRKSEDFKNNTGIVITEDYDGQQVQKVQKDSLSFSKPNQ